MSIQSSLDSLAMVEDGIGSTYAPLVLDIARALFVEDRSTVMVLAYNTGHSKEMVFRRVKRLEKEGLAAKDRFHRWSLTELGYKFVKEINRRGLY